MKIGLQTWGTEGDVRPFFALATALRTRGHDVKLVYTNIEGRAFALSSIDARAVGADYFAENAAHVQRVSSLVFSRSSPFTQARLLIDGLLNPVADAMYDAATELARDCDVVVAHVMSHPSATATLAAKKPYVGVALQPMFPSRELPPPGAPDLGRFVNPLLWRFAARVLESALRSSVNRIRARAGLAPTARLMERAVHDMDVALVAVSPALLPRPSDWAPHVHISGFLPTHEDAEPWAPERELSSFLDAGDPPVFLSFGSMFALDDARTSDALRVMAAAVRAAGVRAIIQAPPAFAAIVPKDASLFTLARAPHRHLFPRCAAIVHHGGAGTTQTALAAARPQVIVHYGADQVMWSRILHEKGVSTKPLARRNLTTSKLATRIDRVMRSAKMRARADSLASEIAKEDGANVAAKHIEAAVERA